MVQKINISMLLIILLTCNQLIGNCQHRSTYVFKDSVHKYKPYLIEYERINFHFLDTVYPYTLFMPQNGEFSFEEGFNETSHPGYEGIRWTIEGKKPIEYKDTFICKTKDTLTISSYFPLLIKNDS